MTSPALPRAQSGRRPVTLTGIEVRNGADGQTSVRGHAALFDTPTMIGPPGVGFEEVIARGAFRKTLSDGADVRFLFNHNPDLVLARTKSGTLTLSEDEQGLRVDAQLAPTTVGRDLAVLLQRGDVTQMSFGFRVVKDQWETVTRAEGGSVERRTVLEAQLFDVSGVTYPAYDETDLALREAALVRELRDVRAGKAPDQATRTEPAAATPPEQEPPTGGETPESPAPTSGASSSTEPAPATPPEAKTEDRSADFLTIIRRHADGHHEADPRISCPACQSAAGKATAQERAAGTSSPLRSGTE